MCEPCVAVFVCSKTLHRMLSMCMCMAWLPEPGPHALHGIVPWVQAALEG